MYLDYFNFTDEPFSLSPNPKFLFWSRQHEEALESLIYGVKARRGFITVIGEVGTGKTTLCRELMNRFDKKTDTAVILNPMMTVLELLQSINDDFGNKVKNRTVKGEIDALNAFLLRRNKRGKNAVILIDEAQHLSIEALEMMRMLSNLETESSKLLQILLIGQPELNDKLNLPELRQLSQRIGVRYLLGAIEYGEMQEYIYHRLTVAGGWNGSLQFDERGLRKIYKYSEGIPRIVNKICDRALLEVYSERGRKVTSKVVKKAVADLNGHLNSAGISIFKRREIGFFKRLFGFQG